MELFELQEVLLESSPRSASLGVGSPDDKYQTLSAALTVAVWYLRTGAAAMGSETPPDSTWHLALILKGVLGADLQWSPVSRGLKLGRLAVQL